MSEAKEYSLGPLPWNKDMLHKAYFSNVVSTTEAIKEHSGYEVESDLLDLRFALEIFLDSVVDLLLSILTLTRNAISPDFGTEETKVVSHILRGGCATVFLQPQ